MVNSNLKIIFFNFKPNGKFKPKCHIFLTLNLMVNSNLMVIFFFFFCFNFKPNGKFKPKGHIFLTLNPMVNSNLNVKFLKFKLKSDSCSINMTIFSLISIHFYKIIYSIRFLFSLNGFPL